MKKLNLFLLSTLFGIVVLTGCGGGGGGDTVSINPANNPITNNPLTQTANHMKDTIISGQTNPIVANGKITIKDPMGHTLGFGITDKDGHYSINIGHYEGPIRVELTCGENSKMVVNGMQMECPAGEMLKAMENVAEGGKEMIINLSPLTNIAESMTNGFGMMSPKNIKKAKRAVFSVFGVDPTRDDLNSYAYSSALKALKEAAKKEKISQKELTDRIEREIEKGYISKNSKATRSFLERVLAYAIYTALIDAINKNHVFDVDVEENTKSNIQKAKKMVEELKEESSLFIDFKDPNHEGELKKEIDLLQNRIENLLVPYSKNAIKNTIEIAKLIKDTIDKNLTSNIKELTIANNSYSLSVSKDENNRWLYEIAGDMQTYAGKANIASKEEKGAIYTINGKIPPAKEEILDTKNYQNINAKVEIEDLEKNKTSINLTAQTTALFSNESPSLDLKILSSKIEVLKNERGYIIKPSTLKISSKIEEFNINGDLNLSNYVENKTFKYNQGNLPSKTVFEGVISNENTLTNFDGRIELSLKDAKETNLSNISKTNPAPYILKISGDLTDYTLNKRAIWAYIEYLDKDSIKIEAQSSRENISIKTEGTAKIDYKHRRIKAFDLKFKNEDLVEFRAKMSEDKKLSGFLQTDGERVGEIKNIDGVYFIKYKDGSLQSLI